MVGVEGEPGGLMLDIFRDSDRVLPIDLFAKQYESYIKQSRSATSPLAKPSSAPVQGT
jgi:hypothetical protein